MDPLQSKETADDSQIENPLIITTNTGEVRIQLEGSHTTSTETESVSSTNKKNVKFEDEKEVYQAKCKEADTSELKNEEEHLKKQEENLDRRKENLSQSQEPSNLQTMSGLREEMSALGNLETTEILDEIENNLLTQQEVQNIDIESGEITQRFEKIMEMFDHFTKNLETLEMAAKPKKLADIGVVIATKKRPKSEPMKYLQEYEVPQKHRSRYEEYYKECQKKIDPVISPTAAEPNQRCSISASTSCAELVERNHAEEYLKLQEMAFKELQNAAEEKKTTNARNISTATSSCELKSLGCQTQLSDHISLNDLSIMEASSLTSRSEQPNSLNNYAQAENACVSSHNSQQQIIKQPLTETLIQQPLQETLTIETGSITTQPRLNVITIEANATPSATDLVRQPFCSRLWEIIGDFCAATLLCLQVNRDCIFCMGFFAAFVVSASFLTAFFYHTLIVNPTLWQVEEETLF